MTAAPADCREHETATSWNITGPPGATGPTGDTAATGAPGPHGPSNAYDGFRNANAAPMVTYYIKP